VFGKLVVHCFPLGEQKAPGVILQSILIVSVFTVVLLSFTILTT